MDNDFKDLLFFPVKWKNKWGPLKHSKPNLWSVNRNINCLHFSSGPSFCNTQVLMFLFFCSDNLVTVRIFNPPPPFFFKWGRSQVAEAGYLHISTFIYSPLWPGTCGPFPPGFGRCAPPHSVCAVPRIRLSTLLTYLHFQAIIFYIFLYRLANSKHLCLIDFDKCLPTEEYHYERLTW